MFTSKPLSFARVLLFLLLCAVLLGTAAAEVAAQADRPTITSFTSPFNTVSRTALDNRSARVPVSWTTVNRPLLANLVFEQVFNDGSAVNVELPRAFPWVASNGDGMAAPTLPPDSAVVTLRVTLYNLINGAIYDQAWLELPVVDGGNGPGGGGKPAIVSFTSCCTSVLRSELEAGTARIPVEWTAVDRPLTATLIFEQVLSDGSVVNVELPRDTPWVNSVDRGVVAPVAPGGGDLIRLRVRLIDLLFQRVLDVRELTAVIVADSETEIRFFTIPIERGLALEQLQRREVYLFTSWAVDNRPANTNLAFEQVFPDGTVRNVELPRDVLIVPSTGNGTVRPFAPPEGVREIQIQLRLVRLSDNVTLDVATIGLPVNNTSNSTTIENNYSREACLSAPFGSPVGLAVGERGRVVETTISGINAIWPEPPGRGDQINGFTEIGDTFTVLEGPYCYTLNLATNNQNNFRLWRVDFDDRPEIGWIQEYYYDLTSRFSLLEVLQDTGDSVDDNLDGCMVDWFVEIDTDRCPAAAASQTQGAYQRFERGMMVWHDGKIDVLLENGMGYRRVDTWTGAEITFDQTPPDGMQLPVRGFGHLWMNDAAIRDQLGWAVEAERGYTVELQAGPDDTALLALMLPTGVPVVIRGTDSLSWYATSSR